MSKKASAQRAAQHRKRKASIKETKDNDRMCDDGEEERNVKPRVSKSSVKKSKSSVKKAKKPKKERRILQYESFETLGKKWPAPFVPYFERLARDGYVVIPAKMLPGMDNVVKQANDNIDKVLACYGGDKDNKDDVTNANKRLPGIHGLQQYGPWAHIDAAWLIRLAVRPAFAAFWGW